MKYFLPLFVLLLCSQLSFSSVIIEEMHDDEEEEHHDPFEELLEKTNSEANESLSLEALQQVLENLNQNCLNSTLVFDLLNVEDGINEEQFLNVSLLVAYRMSRPSEPECSDTDLQNELLMARTNLFDKEQVCRNDIAALITATIENGKYVPIQEGNECFGSSTLLPLCTNDKEVVDEAVMNMIISMARGLCFLPEPTVFQEKLLKLLDAGDQGVVSEENFEDLLKKFQIGEKLANDEDDHDDDHDDDGDDDHDDDHDDDDDDGHGHRRKRNAEENLEEEEEEEKCYTPSQLLTIAGDERNEEGHQVLTMKGLTTICPVILQQFVSGACEEDHAESERRPPGDESYTEAKKYGYGTLSVLLISLLAFGGLLLFPSMGTVGYKMTMQFFIALGVGTLSGDAILHLIPEVVGLHGHEEGDEHDHEEEEEDNSYLFKLTAVLVGIYFFYLIENVLRLYNQLKQKNLEPLNANHHELRKHSHSAPGHEHSRNHMMTRASISIAVTSASEGTNGFHEENHEAKDDTDDVEKARPDAVCCGVTPVGIMVFIGDALHNFGDGLALGVAFSSSFVAGFGASIAIFCHELPHEFGDFAIYLKNGMTKWQGLGMNFLAACCAFIGLYIGLSVGQNVDARQWMLAIIAGMFLYIALVDVLHEMIEEVSEDYPRLMFFLQNLGMCLGWTILLLLALYEDQIGTVIG